MLGCLAAGRENKVKEERNKQFLEEEPKEDAGMVQRVPVQPVPMGLLPCFSPAAVNVPPCSPAVVTQR